jgi:exosortase
MVVAVTAYIWVRLINHLRVEWTANEQYAYGWAVPLLCAFLFWRRWLVPPDALFSSLNQDGEERGWSAALSYFALLIVVAFLFTRWIEEANPDWRLVSWALALEVIALSLIGIYFIGGAPRVKHFAFPLLFFLVAVPWPTAIEQAAIQTLTRGIVAATVELLNAFGFPALPHGNVIETATGFVDVDEACSGIRSLQAVLMLALFFGELRRFTVKKRVGLCGIAFALACFFNLGRTVVLSLVAAKQGSAAVQRWHDPAGIIILVSCFVGVWAAAAWLGRGQQDLTPKREVVKTQSTRALPEHRSSASPRLCVKSFLIVAVAVLLLCGEVAVQFWYATAKPARTIDWTAELPRTNPTFQAVELPPAALRILRFNESQSGAWRNGDGTVWQMFYLRWRPGRTAANLARNHTPEICLPAAGKNLRGISDVKDVQVSGLSLPFRCYTTGQNGKSLFVFYTLWEDGARQQRVTTEFLTWQARWNAVLERRRNPGQRVIQIALSGVSSAAEAEAVLRYELPKLIHVVPSD